MIPIWHDNVVKAGDKIIKDYEDFLNGNQRYTASVKIMNVIGKVQSGKTEVMQYVAYMLNKYRLFYSTTYPNIELNDQFENDMRPFPNVLVTRLTTILDNENQYSQFMSDIKQSTLLGNVLFLGIDESEYRVGHNSILDKLIKKICEEHPQLRIYIMFVGATPSSLRAQETKSNIPIDNIILEPGEGYVGLEELYEMGRVFDTSHIKSSDEKLKPHKDVDKSLQNHIPNYKRSLTMLRANNTNQADYWKIYYDGVFANEIQNGKIQVVVAHTDSYEAIKHSIRRAEADSFYQNIILIVVGGLRAGYRLFSQPSHKRQIIFVYDKSSKDMTNVQGLPGRTCGYYDLRDGGPIIWMRTEAIFEYAKLFDLNSDYYPSPSASTHTQGKVMIESKFIPCEHVGDYDWNPKLNISDEVKRLGYSKNNSRHSTSNFKSSSNDFKRQWEETEKSEPNYKHISYTYGKVKDFALLFDIPNKKVRVMKKTGKEELKKVPRHNAKENLTSMFANKPYSM